MSEPVLTWTPLDVAGVEKIPPEARKFNDRGWCMPVMKELAPGEIILLTPSGYVGIDRIFVSGVLDARRHVVSAGSHAMYIRRQNGSPETHIVIQLLDDLSLLASTSTDVSYCKEKNLFNAYAGNWSVL